MKFYYSPGACSLGIHVILEEIGKPYEGVVVSLKEQAQMKPEFLAVNPKHKVPTLQRDDGSVVTEWPAIALWLAGSNPEKALWPAELEAQVRTLELVDYVCGTVHPQAFSRIFGPARFAPSEADHPKVLETGKANAVKYFDTLEKGWRGGDWAVPGGYSIADAALFFVEYWWAKRVGETLPPKLAAHLERMLARPAVKRALEAEGLPA